MNADDVRQVRSFNRTVSQRIGALNDHFLKRKRSLGEARFLHEIGSDGADVANCGRRWTSIQVMSVVFFVHSRART